MDSVERTSDGAYNQYIFHIHPNDISEKSGFFLFHLFQNPTEKKKNELSDHQVYQQLTIVHHRTQQLLLQCTAEKGQNYHDIFIPIIV